MPSGTQICQMLLQKEKKEKKRKEAKEKKRKKRKILFVFQMNFELNINDNLGL